MILWFHQSAANANLPHMARLRVIWLLAALMPPTVVCAQGDIHALETSLKGKQVQLRSYSADSVVHYTWADGKLIAEPVKMHTFGMFTT
jgi:hypothetical protein